jgi:hypothetical protein
LGEFPPNLIILPLTLVLQNDPQMSQMMLDEEEMKARQMEKVGNDLSRPSIGGNEPVRQFDVFHLFIEDV